MPKLKVTERDTKTKAADLRKDGFVPAIYYGKKEDSTSVSISAREFKKVWKEVGETSTVELELPKGKVSVMIHEVQVDPVRNEVMHVDFYVVEKGQKVEVEVPLVFEGEAPVEKFDGIVVKVLHEVSVEGEPQNIPDEFIIDVTVLTDMESQILVKDLKLPKGIELKTDLEEVIVAVSEAKEEEEEVPEEVDMDTIEVEQKGKKEGEEGEDKEQKGKESTE
ncbi:MAG: 50S ribosomal protein L25 [Candidatus Pacebacteria bacterium]|nr:50S ribosomal protein L25 [Candidatus Paceibacterota bacterium]